MQKILELFEMRLLALIVKEMRQILRDRQLLFMLVFPPTFQLILYGFALNPEVKNLRLAIADFSLSPISRELTSAIVENHVFDVQKIKGSQSSALKAVRDGKIDAALIIPPEFNRQLKAGHTAHVQVILDGVDANSAGLASGYVAQIISTFNRSLVSDYSTLPSQISRQTGMNTYAPGKIAGQAMGNIDPQITFLYNAGLDSTWFFVPGVMGLVLTLAGSLVSSATLIREKDSGTLEQLVMTPASSFEVLLAKITPLFVLLMGNVLLALSVGKFAFHMPFRGSVPLFFLISSIYIFVGISIGITLASISKNQRQAILTSFFFNLPIIQLSGAVAPLNSMPKFCQYLSLLNPLRYYIICIRGILLKGVGLDVLWPNVVILAIFAFVLMSVSANRFRSQLG